MLDKGPGFAADEVIVDLEDSVPAELKDQARAQAAAQEGDPCVKGEVSRTQYTCAMGATSSKGLEQCLR